MSALALNPIASAYPLEPPVPAENPSQRNCISAISARILYNMYLFFNPAPCKPKREFYDSGPISCGPDENDIPRPFEVMRDYILARSGEDPRLLGPVLFACKEQLETYADPAFRIERAREYYEMGLAGRAIEYDRNVVRVYCTEYLCAQEMHDLYQSEYKKKFRNMATENNRWVHNIGESVRAEDNKVILAQYKQTWEGMSASEKAKKICLRGLPSRYLIVALVATSAAGALYFKPSRIDLISGLASLIIVTYVLKNS
jgi:hypothetical protein